MSVVNSLQQITQQEKDIDICNRKQQYSSLYVPAFDIVPNTAKQTTSKNGEKCVPKNNILLKYKHKQIEIEP